MNFQTNLDIINRGLQHCNVPRIWSLNDASPAAREMEFLYDKIRRAELRRNVWKFAVRRTALYAVDTTVYQVGVAEWVKTAIYMAGYIISHGGQWYESAEHNNIGLAPDKNPTAWKLYFGPRTVTPWNTSAPSTSLNQSYFGGDLVYIASMPGYSIWKCMDNSNAVTPYLYPAWSAAAVYNVGDCVIVGGGQTVLSNPGGLSLVGPGGAPLHLVDLTSNNNIYQSVREYNIDRQPGVAADSWVTIPVTGQKGGFVGKGWHFLETATLQSFRLAYPLGSGPASDVHTRNLFMLPAGHLRRAPQTAGAFIPSLGAGSGNGQPLSDWEFTDRYIVSDNQGPLLYRFVADVQDVLEFDDMFCEAVAARCALEMPAEIVGKRVDKPPIRQAYRDAVSEARLINGIEEGALESPEDSFISVRA